MANTRARGQKLVAFPLDGVFLQEIDDAREEVSRSAFIRKALHHYLNALALEVPEHLRKAPDRAGKKAVPPPPPAPALPPRGVRVPLTLPVETADDVHPKPEPLRVLGAPLVPLELPVQTADDLHSKPGTQGWRFYEP